MPGHQRDLIDGQAGQDLRLLDGGMAIPSGTMLQGKLYQNETVLFYISAPANGLKAPGSRWTDSYNAFFRHGVKTTFTYAFLNIRGMKECKTTNNQASITINEAALHANSRGMALRAIRRAGERRPCPFNSPSGPASTNETGRGDAGSFERSAARNRGRISPSLLLATDAGGSETNPMPRSGGRLPA